MTTKQRVMNSGTIISLKGKLDHKSRCKCGTKKAPPIPLGDNLSETAGQKTLRDAPVVLKLRRKVAAFFGYFLLL